MIPKVVLLWTDAVVLVSLLLALAYGWRIRASAHLRATWIKVWRDTPAICSAVVLLLFFAVAVVDSVHFRRALPASGAQQEQAYGTRTESLLDVLLARQIAGRESSYSAPLAMRGFTKDSVEVNGRLQRTYPRLSYGGERLSDEAEWLGDVMRLSLIGLAVGLSAALLAAAGIAAGIARKDRVSWPAASFPSSGSPVAA